MVHMRDGEIPVASDERLDFIQDFTLKALRVKPDKWARMMISDEQRTFISAFIERNRPQVIGIFALNIGLELFENNSIEFLGT